MTLGERISRFFFKESQARMALTVQQVGKPQSSPVNYETMARLGYAKSAIAYTCISKIAGAARGFKWSVYDISNPKKPKELSAHPLLTLWNKPNPLQSTADLIENYIAFYCLAGNSYLEANRGALKSGPPLELWNVRPDKIKIVPSDKGYPAEYQFTANGLTRSWPVDQVNFASDILHWKTFHPLDVWYGMAPLQAALLALDQNIAGQEWNLALLQNSATPSGVLQVKVTDANPRGELTDEQYKRMRADYERNYQGVANTGKPMIIEGGLTWTQMSHSPRDVDYAKGKELTATDICLVFGIPPELLGMGQKTFNNYREARLSFYEETVLPIVDAGMANINRWLAPAFGENIAIQYDKDAIDILNWKREQKFTSLATVNFLTQNEKRTAVDYEAKEGWDVFVIGNQLGENPEDFTGGGSQGTDSADEAGTNSDSDAEDDGKPDDEKPEADTEEEDDTSNESDNMDDGKGWKSFNLVNANERKQSWRRQNARRKELQRSMDRDVKSDFDELTSELKKVKGVQGDAKLTEFALLNVISDFMPVMKRTIKKHVKYTVYDFGGQILGEGKTLGFDRELKASLRFDSFVESYAERRSGQAIKTITSTTQKQIKKIVGEWVATTYTDGDSIPTLSKFIEAEFRDLTPAMATRIARTEVATASNRASLEAVKSLQIPNMFKEWVTANDDRVRDGDKGGADHGVMNGAEVGLEEKFGVPPDSLMDGPGDDSAPADQIINCRCVLVYRSRN